MLGRISYPLDGRKVLFVLDPEFLKALGPMGVASSPLYALVHKVEEGGVWLDNPYFPLCPPDRPRLLTHKGEEFCRAHVFVPNEAIVSIAAFDQAVEEADETPIGFQAPSGKK